MNVKDMTPEQIHDFNVKVVDFFIDYICPSEFAKAEGITIEQASKVFQDLKKSKCYEVI